MSIQFRYDRAANVLFTTADGLVTYEDIQQHLIDEPILEPFNNREMF